LTKNELRAVLKAFRESVRTALPSFCLRMEGRDHAWSKASETELQNELNKYFVRASEPTQTVRLFFKLGPDLVYGGCNNQFAADGGFSKPKDMIGLTDFDPRISWIAQAAKYRKNDREVMERGQPLLGIIERQSSTSGIIWLDTSKVPIADGSRVIGIFGTYEIIDSATAWRRSMDRQKSESSTDQRTPDRPPGCRLDR